MAGVAIDLDEIATPEILDPRQVQRQYSGFVPLMFILAGFQRGSRLFNARFFCGITPAGASGVCAALSAASASRSNALLLDGSRCHPFGCAADELDTINNQGQLATQRPECQWLH